MSPRTLFTAILVTALPFAAVACGDDEPEATTGSTTTTTVDESDTSDAGTSDADTSDTTDTTDDESSDATLAFADGLDEARSRLDGASSICDLVEISDYVDSVQQPEGPEEVKAAVEFQSDLWRAIADSAPEEFAAQAQVIRGIAEQFPAEAEAVDYDFQAIGDLESINSQEFEDALLAFYQATVETC